MRTPDKIYAAPQPQVVDFTFDASVAAVFPDMLRRSVPGYETIISLLGVLAERYAQADSTIYDLGCSLGAAMLAMQSRLSDASIRFVGVDQSAAMLRQCRNNLEAMSDGKKHAARFSLLHGDVREVEITNASMVIVNFTLQFIDPADRLALLSRIHAGLKSGGVAVLSEKVCAEDAAESDLQQALHEQFKIANGYSELEIAQKRTALENIMRLDSAATHIKRLRRAHFSSVAQWFQAFNFCSFVAIK